MQKEIDFLQLLSILRKRLWIIISFAIVGTILAFTISKFVLKPVYSAKITLYVYNQTGSQENTTLNDINLSQKLVNTYIIFLKSDTVLANVAEKVNFGYSAGQIREMIKANSVNNTEVFEVSVQNTNPKQAQIIANTIADCAPDMIIRVVKAGSVEVIDYATLPVAPISPKIMTNTIIGFLLGILLSVGVSVLIEFIDTSINCESDLIDNYHLPILGVIPSFEKAGSKKGEKGYGSQK
jgi:capsular polysaccharide biosynthesis protein